MDDGPELSDPAAAVLQAVYAEGSADLYALARAVGTGPRAVQEAVQQLSRKNLVVVSDRGAEVHCTPAGEDAARAAQRRS
jgi:Mn-dependent DtxR family transcriptional regulator